MGNLHTAVDTWKQQVLPAHLSTQLGSEQQAAILADNLAKHGFLASLTTSWLLTMLTRKWLHKQWHTWACLWPSHKQSISIGSSKPDRTSTAQEPLCASLTLQLLLLAGANYVEAAAPAVHPRKQVIYMDDRSWTSTSVDTLAQTMSAWHTFGGVCGLKESTDRTQIAYYTQQHLDLLQQHPYFSNMPQATSTACVLGACAAGEGPRSMREKEAARLQAAKALCSKIKFLPKDHQTQEYWQSAELVGWPSPPRNANSSKLTRRSAMSVVLSWGQQSLRVTCFLVVLRSLRWSLV